jgi:nucleotide-binding universal stress UspA family protein
MPNNTQTPASAPTSTTLLIATDFSPSSCHAVMHGFRTATLWGVNPHVLHVCRAVDGLLLIETGPERLMLTPNKARAYVAQHVEQLLQLYTKEYGAPHFGVAVSHVLVGHPAECITTMASDLRASLIVVGTSRRTGVQRWLLGSTAEHVVRDATCPVLVSRNRVPGPEEHIEPPCEACIETRYSTGGREIWCERHRQNEERRHTYHYRDKNARVRENLPLLFPMSGR